MKPVSSDPYRWIIIGFQVSYRSDLSFDRTGVKRLEIDLIKINLKSIWKFCFKHNFFIRSNLDVKLFPSRSEYFKTPISIYGFTQFRSGVRTGFLGHVSGSTYIYQPDPSILFQFAYTYPATNPNSPHFHLAVRISQLSPPQWQTT